MHQFKRKSIFINYIALKLIRIFRIAKRAKFQKMISKDIARKENKNYYVTLRNDRKNTI